MNIHIIKNAMELPGKTIQDNFILQIKENESDYENVKQLKYYLYDVNNNESYEVEPSIPKYDLITVKDIKYRSTYIYFSSVDKKDEQDDLVTISVYRYDINEGKSTRVYDFEERLEQYSDYMRTRIYAVNEYYLFVQNEFLRANLTEDYAGHFDFEQFMYSVNENKKYKIVDERLNQYGISDFEPVSPNVCVLKSGYDLYTDERYKFFNKDEAAFESVNFINIGQMVSDILIGRQVVVMDTVESAHFTATIPYIKIEDGYVIYSKIKFEDKMEEEIVFYNFAKKNAVMCINSSNNDGIEPAKTGIMENRPYIIIKNHKGYEYIDISAHTSVTIGEMNNCIEYFNHNMFVVSEKIKNVFGKEKNMFYVYKFPSLKLLHREKGIYRGAVVNEEGIHIMSSNK